MHSRDLHRYVRLWGLAWLLVAPVSGCEEGDPEQAQDHDSSGSSSSSGGSSRSWRRSPQRNTVAQCKEDCDDDCGDCKADCDRDDEDCNQHCDNERYDCRRACEKIDNACDSCGSTCHDRCDDDCDDRCDERWPDAGSDAGADAGSSGGSDAGTGDSDDMSVTIQFEAHVGTQAFACGEEYEGLGTQGTTVTPTDLRLFVQDVKLITSRGKEVPVALDVRGPWQSESVVLLDFEDGDGECGEGNREINTKITGKVPRGTYTGISFSNGVPERLNHADPTDARDPLDEYAGLSWGWLGGFRFAKVEVRELTNARDFGCGVAHIGSTACTGNPSEGTVRCRKSNRNRIELDDFDPLLDVVVFDVAEVFAETDLTKPSECHSTGEHCAPMFEAFGVDFSDGEPLSTQSVFHVE